MIPVETMPVMITAILLVCGYLALLQAINSHARNSMGAAGNILIIDLIVAVLYVAVCAVTGLAYIYTGYNFYVIYVILAFGVGVTLILFLRFCWKNRDGIKKRNLALFLVYFGVVLYLTIFMRIGYGEGLDTSVSVVPFDDLFNAFQKKDPVYLKHLASNILLFVPFGCLIPAINREALGKCSFAFLGGIMCSTVIEGLQLVFCLGQSDIDDIIANSVGAVVGYIAVRLIWRIQKNWKV